MNRTTSSLLAVALVASVLLTAQPAAAAPIYDEVWEFELDGWNRSSSPVIADIDADGENEIVFGHQDGILRAYEADGSLKWSTPAVPGVGDGCNGQTGPTAIDSSPAVADIDADGTPEVVIGVGSTWVTGQNGGVITFDGKTGAIEWRTNVTYDTGRHIGGVLVYDGWCEGVYATPAIGDVDGDGHLDVVFTGWDFMVWAVDRNGNGLPGFPFNSDDTIWSSPALFDIDGDDDMEIFTGADTTPGGYYDHLGGIIRAFDWTPDGVVNLWNRNTNEVIHSSPAIGDINNDGRPELVVGAGNHWTLDCAAGNPSCSPGDGSDRVKVFAVHLHDGSDVPGWPVSTGDTNIGSPALGDLDGDGELEVTVGSADGHVYAWNGDGSRLWRVRADMAHFTDSARYTSAPIIADLQGDGRQDVAIGSSGGMALLDGATGASLEASLIWPDRVGFGISYEAAAAVGELGGERRIVTMGFDTPGRFTRVASYELPASSAEDAWPMFGRNAARTGAGNAPICGFDQSGSFCDVVVADYYHDAVAWMVAEGITNGVSNYSFGPDLSLTRAQMVTFLWREAGSPGGHDDHGFVDVPDGSFYAEAVRWAKANAITTGTSATTFSPNDTVTRGQLVTLLWRREGEPGATAGGDFADVPGGRYFTDAVGWAKANSITNGTSPTTFSPDDPVTRGQAAALVYRTAGEPEIG